MKIKYLGTGASEGWPGVFCQCALCQQARQLGGKNIRRRSSAVVGDSLLIDLPPDIYGSALNHGFDLSQIKHFAITHNHGDHLYAAEIGNATKPFAHILDGEPVHFYGSSTVVGTINAALGKGFDGPLKVTEVFAFQGFAAGGCTVTPLPARHSAGVCFVYLVESGGKSLLYANDTGLLPEETLDYLGGRRVDLVSMDCTLQEGNDYVYHMGIDGNVRTMKKLIKIGAADKKTIFISTHFSHNGGRLRPFGIVAAYDGMVVEF
jgi:phosphoribosyl 1,2-cyclic phosphate phosphodiesterase